MNKNEKTLLKKYVRYVLLLGLMFSVLKFFPLDSKIQRASILIGILFSYMFVEKVVDKFYTVEHYVQLENNDMELVKLTEEEPSQSKNTIYTNQEPSCKFEVEKVRRELNQEIETLRNELLDTTSQTNKNTYTERYMNNLAQDLRKKGIIDNIDVMNINSKLKSKLLTLPEIIGSLEELQKIGRPKNVINDKGDWKYNELNPAFFTPIGAGLDNWSNQYSILNTDKWKVPEQRPPVCAPSKGCKVCPNIQTTPYLPLSQWDDSRRISTIGINKKFVNELHDTSV